MSGRRLVVGGVIVAPFSALAGSDETLLDRVSTTPMLPTVLPEQTRYFQVTRQVLVDENL